VLLEVFKKEYMQNSVTRWIHNHPNSH